MNCPTCGGPVKVEGKTTQYYVPERAPESATVGHSCGAVAARDRRMARHWRGEYKQARGLLCDLEPLLLYIQEEQGPKTLTPDLHQFMNEIEEAREFLRLTDSSSVDGEGK